MPIYEYKCRECGAKFEKLVRSFGTSDIKCPKCGSEQTEKMLSTFATSGVTSSSGGGSFPSAASCGPGAFS